MIETTFKWQKNNKNNFKKNGGDNSCTEYKLDMGGHGF